MTISITCVSFICAAVMPIIAVMCLCYLLLDIRDAVRLERKGQTIQAEIIKRRTVFSLRPRLFGVVYRFEAEKAGKLRRYSREQVIGYKSFQRLNGESQITVKYNPNDPDFSAMAGIYADHIGRLYAAIVGAALLIACGLLVYGYFIALQD
jgi:hypothetical protein